MTTQVAHAPSGKSMTLLSRLLLLPRTGDPKYPSKMAALKSDIRNISREEFDDLLSLAHSNHVIVRGMELFLNMMREAKDATRAEWAETALTAERARIKNAVTHLHEICIAFEDEKLDVTVIKSLDHWPDLGSDVDLYSNADSKDVIDLMKRRFNAKTSERSWGDRLARKWNFEIPGLPESVEIHVGRLGQTGEQVSIAARIAARARQITVNDLTFRVTSVSDRLMISTLQRMYRHFYFRLCDIVDNVTLFETIGVDFDDLRSSSDKAGIWEGVATYLVIVSDYVKQYRGTGLELPQIVKETARFGGDQVFYRKEFLRVPIMPQSAKLYGSQLAGLLRKRELQNGARLSLLPWLATAALVGQKITGSDKGIW